MITDINIIKKSLKGYKEVNSFNLTPNSDIKYITLKNNREYFYNGGIIDKIGDNKIFIYNSGNTWAVPIKLMDNNCNVFYKSRFFEKENKKKEKKEIKELKNIIEAQQRVINKLYKTPN